MAIPQELQAKVWDRDNGHCRYCRLSQYGQASRFHIDHIRPKSLGGNTELSNLALLCPHCNLHKSTRLTAMEPETGMETPLFHPLLQRWDEHFILRRDGTCHGISATGKATVAALSMNHHFAVRARSLQIQFGVLSPTEQERN